MQCGDGDATMRFFGFGAKPAWRHADGTRRADAVATGMDPDLLAALSTIAATDSDSRVRIAAIRRIDDVSQLRTLLAAERDQPARDVLSDRLLSIAVAATSAPGPGEQTWIDALPEASRQKIAREAGHADWRRLALRGLNRPTLLVERCIADPDPTLRRELLDRIDDPDSLERIAQKTRKSDKQLARAAADRVHAMRLAAGDPDALRMQAMALGERLTSLRKQPAETLAAGLSEVEREWSALASRVDSATATIIEGHLIQARAALARSQGANIILPGLQVDDVAHAQGSADANAQKPGPPTEHSSASDGHPRLDALEKMVDACALRAEELDEESLAGIVEGFSALWREIPAHGPGSAAIRRRFDELVERARARLDTARATARALAENTRRTHQEEFRGALIALKAAIDEAALADARAAIARLDSAISLLGDVPREHRRDEASARQALAKLIANQRWSLNRQRSALGDSAAALLGQGLHPDAVAARVKELREAWDRLDGIARAAGEEPDPESGLARRFRALTGKALAPTRRYFAERQKIRAARADEYAALAEPLAADAVDDRALAMRRRAVASALRQLDDIDPARRGDIGRRLRGALASLDALRSERAESAELARRRLLANLGRRFARAELATALTAAREAEVEWAKLPRARPEIERTLRAEFDALVDPWFERERSGRAEANANRAALLGEAEAIVRELESLAANDQGNATELDHQMAALKRRWQQLADSAAPAAEERQQPVHGQRPGRSERQRSEAAGRRTDRNLLLPTQRFDSALRAADATRQILLARAATEARARRAAPLLALRALEAKADARARNATGAGGPSSIVLHEALEAVSALPPRVLARRDAAVAVLEGRGSIDDWIRQSDAAAEEAIRLAVRAECVAGIESPPEDAALRRATQVGRLESRMRGGAALDPRAELAAIEEAFEHLGPLGAATASIVGSRIAAAAAALGQGGS